MSYEKEISELWKDWKSSTDKYAEAIEDGYDVDADMWAHDVMEIERQIYVYEQAAKADEYEAKAKSFDRIVEQRKKTGVITLGHYAWEIIRELESGEYDAQK